MKAESLIFDIDGTLWDTRALVAEGYNAQLESEGYGRYAVTAEDLTPLFGKSLPEMADVLFGRNIMKKWAKPASCCTQTGGGLCFFGCTRHLLF